MTNKAGRVKRWRNKTKDRIVESMGGKCVLCGYNKCKRAMDIHHLRPEEKDMRISTYRANPASWDRIVNELRKCVLLCNRCHAEVHEGITIVPKDAQRFIESYAQYKELVKKQKDCPVCGKAMYKYTYTCSKSCAGTLKGKVDWENPPLVSLISQGLNNREMASIYCCSEAAVRKRRKKLLM